MKTIINKRPNEEYLAGKTFTINQREYDLIQNKEADTEIQVFSQAQALVYTIPKKKYKKLVCSSKTAYNEDGVSNGNYFVVNFSGAV